MGLTRFGRRIGSKNNFLLEFKCNDPNEDTNPRGPREKNSLRARACNISGFHCRIKLNIGGPLEKTPA